MMGPARTPGGSATEGIADIEKQWKEDTPNNCDTAKVMLGN
jgi:hypothetical protein